MYKRIFLSFIFLITMGQLVAQTNLPYRPLQLKLNNDKLLYGVKFGANMPRMYYSGKNLKKLPHDFRLSPTISLFVEFNLHNKLSMAMELNYQQKGTATSYVYEDNYNVSYKLKADYMAIRIPFYWYFINDYKIGPYMFLGPDVAYAFGGNISLSQPGLSIPEAYVHISDSNINRLYVGALGGLGVRKNVYLKDWILVLKLDGALNCGFLNTFSSAELNETATPVNVHAYNSQKGRYSVGLEINFSLGITKYNIDTNCFPFD